MIAWSLFCVFMAFVSIRAAWGRYMRQLQNAIPLTGETAWLIALGGEVVTPPNVGNHLLLWLIIWLVGLGVQP